MVLFRVWYCLGYGTGLGYELWYCLGYALGYALGYGLGHELKYGLRGIKGRMWNIISKYYNKYNYKCYLRSDEDVDTSEICPVIKSIYTVWLELNCLKK